MTSSEKIGSVQIGGSKASRLQREMKTSFKSARRRESRKPLRDPAFWAWLIAAMLAMIPAASALHVILA